jgi:hypothetical protein
MKTCQTCLGRGWYLVLGHRTVCPCTRPPVKVLLDPSGEPFGTVLPEPVDDREEVIKRYRPGMIIEAAGGHLLGLPHNSYEPVKPPPGWGSLPVVNKDDFDQAPFYSEGDRLMVRYLDPGRPMPPRPREDYEAEIARLQARVQELEERLAAYETDDPDAMGGPSYGGNRHPDE